MLFLFNLYSPTFKKISLNVLNSNSVNINALNLLKQSPLHYSVISQQLEMTTYLLENGAFIDFKDDFNHTALDYAKKMNNNGICNIINKWNK